MSPRSAEIPVRLELRLAGVVLVVFGSLGAVPGDVGGCGQPRETLEPARFFQQLREIECEQCTRCSLGTQACRDACFGAETNPTAFPEDCVPLVHDGEVCLRAIEAAACGAFATYVDDDSPRLPTECDFCPPPEGK
ncbi:MAG: hypothetical protein JW751_22390 [Polyangiaceae bacterium]|nr:hypothetical protein [Polyangiaceae bacterium]